ncbi:unnamed protein product [Rhizophagus irregularis]|nr:unnamed protein product [Rhizophagus irregularis]
MKVIRKTHTIHAMFHFVPPEHNTTIIQHQNNQLGMFPYGYINFLDRSDIVWDFIVSSGIHRSRQVHGAVPELQMSMGKRT